jgi:hypothetical protein
LWVWISRCLEKTKSANFSILEKQRLGKAGRQDHTIRWRRGIQGCCQVSSRHPSAPLPIREGLSRHRYRLELPHLMDNVGYLLDVIGRNSELLLDFVLLALELYMLEPFGIRKVSQ